MVGNWCNIQATLCRRNTRFMSWVVTLEWRYIHLQCSQLNHDSNMGWSSRSRRFAEVTCARFGDANFVLKNTKISRSGYLPFFHHMLRLPRKVALQWWWWCGDVVWSDVVKMWWCAVRCAVRCGEMWCGEMYWERCGDVLWDVVVLKLRNCQVAQLIVHW